MTQGEEGFHDHEEQLKSRLSFLKESLMQARKQMSERGLLTPDIEAHYQGLLAKLDLDEELIEPELADALNDILSDREKEIQFFINSAKQ